MEGFIQIQIKIRIQILKEGLVFHLLQLLLADVGHCGSVGLWKKQFILIECCLQVFSLETRIGTERIFEFLNLDFSFVQPLRTSLQKTFEKLTLRHLEESAVHNCDEK